MGRFGVIVDGFSSGKYYPSEFEKLGYKCLHVMSRDNIPKFITGCFCDGAYHAAITHYNIEKTSNWIASFGTPSFIIPGCEIGVNLADELSNRFSLKNANPLDLTVARRDKYLMLETLRSNGIRSIRQTCTCSAEEAIAWIKNEQLAFPVVAKPLQSTSGEGFTLCQNEIDVINSFESILKNNNLLNISNQAVLIQEFIEGDEYVVDCVSIEGQHVVSDFLKYKKSFTNEGNSIYKSCHFLARDFKHSTALQKYVFDVLNALKIYNGPSHAEVMLDKHGPILIEIGARPAGCMLDPELICSVYGHSQISLSVLAYADPEKFIQITPTLNTSLNNNLGLVFVSALTDGFIRAVNFDPIYQLTSFNKIDFHLELNTPIRKTRNLSEAAAIVYLLHESYDQVCNDEEYILGIESDLIEIEKSGTDGTLQQSSDYVKVDSDYLNFTATLCGAVKNRSYELCGIAQDNTDLSLDILDVGCGSGIDLIAMGKILSTKSRLIGIDIDAGLIADAKNSAKNARLDNTVFHVLSANELRDEEQYDCVRSERLFQHIREPKNIIRNMIRALKPFGKLVIVDTDWSSLNACALSEQENKIIADFYASNLTNKISIDNLETLVMGLGAENVSTEKISVRLEHADYFKIIKGQEYLEGAFKNEEYYQRVVTKLNSGCSLPMYASVDMILISATKAMH